MDVSQIGLLAAVAGLSLRYFLIPSFDKKIKDAELSKLPKLKALKATVQSIMTFAFWLSLSALLATLIKFYLTSNSGQTLAEIQSKLTSISSAQAIIGKMSSGLSVVVTSLLLCALIALGFIRAKKIEEKHLSERLVAKREDIVNAMGAEEKHGSLTKNDALSEAVLERENAVTVLRKLIADLKSGEKSLSDLPDNTTLADVEARVAEIEDENNEIRAIAVNLEANDIAYDAIDTEVKLKAEKSAPKSFLQKFGTFFISEGMFKTTSTGLKVLGIFVLLMSIPASLAITLPPVAESLDTRQIELTESAREIEFDIQVASANDNYVAVLETTEQAQTSVAEVDTSDFTDDEVADGLARIFESEVIPASIVAADAGTRISLKNSSRHSVRNNILRNHANQSRGNLSAELSRSASRTTNKFTLAQDFVKRSDTKSEPVTKIGKQAATKNRAIAKTNQAQWKVMKRQYSSYVKSFGRVAPPQQIRSLAVSQILGDIIPTGNAAPSALGRSFQQAATNLSADSIEAYTDAAYKNFTADVAKGTPIEDAVGNNKKLSSVSLSSADNRRLKSIANDVPDRARLNEISARNRVHLYSRAGTSVSDDVSRSVARLSRINGFGTAQSAEALASFADYFPSQAGDQQRTSWAKAAQSNNLKGAPPVPGTETRKYRQAARSNLNRSRSFRSLRGFSRVGGVLIGRQPERVDIKDLENSESLNLSAMRWELKGKSAYFYLQVKDKAEQRIGPFDPAIVNLALAYAADGRPTTVTMVKAEPLADLKILNHVTLEDTGLGCKARRLDQFVDEITSEDSRLQRTRETATIEALNEIQYYEYARALRLKNYLSRPAVAVEMPDSEMQSWISDAEETLAEPSIIESVETVMAQKGDLFIKSKPAYFDAVLVSAMQSCRIEISLQSLNLCLNQNFEPDYESQLVSGKLNWLAPAPEYDIWSGVREDEYSLDSELSFVTLKPGQNVWPFRFIVQIALKSPAYFADRNTSWLEEDNEKRDNYVDLSPWEFSSINDSLNSSISKGVASNRERQSVMKDMQQFAVLQRLFRGLFDGYILAGDGVNLLETVQAQTQPFVNTESPTLRWNPNPGAIETNLYSYLVGQLENTESEKEAIISCAGMIEDVGEDGNIALSKISKSKWEQACNPTSFQDEQTSSIVDYFSAARDLRTSLKVDDSLLLSEKYAQQGCPRP